MDARTAEEANLVKFHQKMNEDGDPPSMSIFAPLGVHMDWCCLLYKSRIENGVGGYRTELARLMNNVKQPTKEQRRFFDLLCGSPAREDEGSSKIVHAASGKRILRVMHEEELLALPDPKWTISHILPEKAVSLAFGESSVGKTFFCLHAAKCCAYGMEWFGRKVNGGRVLYIYAEGQHGLKLRLKAWHKHYNRSSTDRIDYVTFPVQLIGEQEVIMDTIAELQAQSAEPYALIVVDTFSNCSQGINQNDSVEVGRVLATAHDIVFAYGCHVLVTHHTNKQGGFNGAMAFKNHVDTMLELKEEEGSIIMRCEKQRDGAEKFEDIRLALKQIPLGTDQESGEQLSSCVLVPSDFQHEDAREKAQMSAEEKMLSLLDAYGHLSTNKWKQLAYQQGVPERTFDSLLMILQTREVIESSSSGLKGSPIRWGRFTPKPSTSSYF